MFASLIQHCADDWFAFQVFVGLTVAFALIHYLVAHVVTEHSPRFNLVHPRHKVTYVVADITKAAVLAGMCLSPRWWQLFFRAFWFGDWDAEFLPWVRWFVLVYTSTDAAQFITVKISKRSTIMHHMLTSLFGVYMCFQHDFHPLVRAMLWYGAWSSVAFGANAYKALRVVYGPSRYMNALRLFALYSYAGELTVNWIAHTVFIIRAFSAVHWLGVVFYAALTLVLMNDDIDLVNFLKKPCVEPLVVAKLTHPYVQPVPVAWTTPHGIAAFAQYLTRDKNV